MLPVNSKESYDKLKRQFLYENCLYLVIFVFCIRNISYIYFIDLIIQFGIYLKSKKSFLL